MKKSILSFLIMMSASAFADNGALLCKDYKMDRTFNLLTDGSVTEEVSPLCQEVVFFGGHRDTICFTGDIQVSVAALNDGSGNFSNDGGNLKTGSANAEGPNHISYFVRIEGYQPSEYIIHRCLEDR